jgi:integrase
MWFEERKGAPLPFLARWRLPGGKKDGQAFESERDRAEFAEAWAEKRRNYGRAAIHVSPRDAEALAEFRKLTGGADLLAVARDWLRWRGVADGAITLKDAERKYREALASGGGSPDSIAQRDLQLRRLVAAFPEGTRLADVSADALNRWLGELRTPRGGPAEPRTKRAHRGTVARLLDYAVGAGWLTRSPMSAVPVPAPKSEDVSILSVEDTRKLFAAAAGTRCVGRLALEAFGGLRFSSAQRITREDLADAARGITFPAAKHKTGKRHYVEGFPANLWAWIETAPAECWELSPRLYALDKRAMFEAAKLKGGDKDDEALRNCLRHSFATYHLAAHKNSAATAYLLTHSKPTMLYQHYAGRATQADGLAYFEILPSGLRA